MSLWRRNKKVEPIPEPVHPTIKFRKFDDPDPEWVRLFWANDITGEWCAKQYRDWLPIGYAWDGGVYGDDHEEFPLVYASSREKVVRLLDQQIKDKEDRERAEARKRELAGRWRQVD